MSDAVELREVAEGVVQVTMQDRAHKNTFSSELITGLDNAFKEINASQCYRAVVLTGYDTYFCSGGTQETLLLLQQGQGRFTDLNLYSMPMDCKIPVVAAVQGHAIGGGLVFALFADCVVLGRENIYTANFMKYGFTPGMGATYILPRKLGVALADEMLLSARHYRGADLERRGVPFPVLARVEVLPYALQLARELAEKPRVSLVTLKSHLIAAMRAPLQSCVEAELVMHEKTFHLPEVRQRIQSLFGQ